MTAWFRGAGCTRWRASCQARRQNASGGKERLASICKAGNRYLCQLLVVGAMAVIRYAERNGTRRPWLVQLMARRTTKVAAVARPNGRPDGGQAASATGSRSSRRTRQGERSPTRLARADRKIW
ncbi:MAG: transposase [Rhizobiaceae bacterium]